MRAPRIGLALTAVAALAAGSATAFAAEPGPDTLPISVIAIQTDVADEQAEALTKAKGSLRGNVLFVFQPAEEGAPPGEVGGASEMLKAGIFEKYKPEVAIGLHVWASLNTGTTLGGNKYTYAPTKDDGTACTTAAGDCTKYTLTAEPEGSGSNIVYNSLN